MNTLIADDELVSRKKMQKIMESFGECTTVETGADAVTTFKGSLRRGKPFDLIT
jgi:two-component system chemotaxis response regulator CheY